MALSEDEKRVLAQLEELMSAEDPQFAQSMAEQTKTVSSITPRAIAIGVLAILLGLGIVFGAVAIKVPALGVLGFLLATFGVYWASTQRTSRQVDAPASEQPTKPSSAFMSKLEERWDERERGEGRF
ncbi:MAG: DUF3040 domain-containing protein [Rothia sp. (in: high G+C Gram-positive bacteria)]|uniref:DUF3040 domain-containing protein n=1 Tax=Rothia sp. (in: high G+C Gram-positive bacteria) TaxID=1885016 RepID=UPI0026E0A7BC|nr:DUF3040 domain-containing protein [Rothia sp. (in: high G+C Gram-positive bacteria)]MDO5751089.1 DUF3040 domain-containing protein [Rothia sp. (in: high G+C Gram-positive bacteria)]